MVRQENRQFVFGLYDTEPLPTNEWFKIYSA